MQLHCQHCGTEIPAENINLERFIAKCSACNSVFSFAEQIGEADFTPPVESMPVPMPKGLSVSTLGGRLEITRRWFSLKYVFITFFTLFWDGFMIVWFTIAIRQGLWPMALFGTLHAAVGVGLAYYVLTGFLNSTVITVDKRELTIRHGPLPWWGNKSLNAKEITQLYCKDRVHHGKNSTSYSYEIHLIVKGDQHEKIVTGLDESEQALYIEQEIERFLDIQDRPVRGELSR